MKPVKRRVISSTVKRLREILATFPDKDSFTINENPSDILIGCIKDDVEFRRAYMKFGLMRVTEKEFREILDDLKNA